MTGNGLLQLRQEIDGFTSAIVLGIKTRSAYGKSDEKDALSFNKTHSRVLEIYFGNINYFCSIEHNNSERYQVDAKNLNIISQRVAMGEKVANAKLKSDLELWTITDPIQIRTRMTNREREMEVISRALSLGREYDVSNYEMIGELMRAIIDVTLDVEVDFIQKAQVERDNLKKVQSLGWGSSKRTKYPVRIGWR